MAFAASRDPKEAYQEGAITARERGPSVWSGCFFPDADVNNNPDNPIINIRSYGENPADVSAFVAAFIEGRIRSPRRGPDYREAFPWTWRYGHGHASGSGDDPEREAALEKSVDAVPGAIKPDGFDHDRAYRSALARRCGLPETLSRKILTALRQRLASRDHRNGCARDGRDRESFPAGSFAAGDRSRCGLCDAERRGGRDLML